VSVSDRFEINLEAHELRRNGTQLQPACQPFQVLAILSEHASDVVALTGSRLTGVAEE
jgi:hypothetical protein